MFFTKNVLSIKLFFSLSVFVRASFIVDLYQNFSLSFSVGTFSCHFLCQSFFFLSFSQLTLSAVVLSFKFFFVILSIKLFFVLFSLFILSAKAFLCCSLCWSSSFSFSLSTPLYRLTCHSFCQSFSLSFFLPKFSLLFFVPKLFSVKVFLLSSLFLLKFFSHCRFSC